MACALTQGYTLAGCKDGIGGIREVYFIEKSNVSSYVKVSGVVTALTKASTKRFWKYELQRATSTFVETIEGVPDNGTYAINQELTIVLNRLETAVRNEIILLAKNNLYAVVKDRNGRFWLLGEQDGLDLTGGEGGPGTAGTDRSGHTLIFTGQESEFAAEVNSTVAAALETPG